MGDLLWPVYEFRPLPGDIKSDLRRYADGQWIPDDGEYDIAFSSWCMAYGVDLPYQRNIIWQWVDRHSSAHEARHPRGNAWHYMLRDGTKEWGGKWGRDRHPNRIAYEAAMSFTVSRDRCANGRGPEMCAGDAYIAAGLLRERDSKRIVTPPDPRICMYCDQGAPQ